MEPGDVSGSALWDPVKRVWSQNVIDAIDPELANKLPQVQDLPRCWARSEPNLSRNMVFLRNVRLPRGQEII